MTKTKSSTMVHLSRASAEMNCDIDNSKHKKVGFPVRNVALTWLLKKWSESVHWGLSCHPFTSLDLKSGPRIRGRSEHIKSDKDHFVRLQIEKRVTQKQRLTFTSNAENSDWLDDQILPMSRDFLF